MAALKHIIKDYGTNDIRKLSIEFHEDENADLVYVLNKTQKHFFTLVKELSYSVKHKNYSSPLEEFKEGAVFKCVIPFIDFNTQNKNGENTVYGEDLDELIHHIELTMGKNLIDWNEKAVKSLNKIVDKVPFQNEVEKNLFLINLYKNKFSEEDYWYEKHHSIFSEKKLTKLKKLRGHLEKIDFNLLNLPTIPSIEECTYPKINFLNKLFGYDKELIADYEKDLEILKVKIHKLSKQKSANQSLNELFIKKIEELKITIDEQISAVGDEINGGFKNNILKYEEGGNNVYFANSILRYSILNSLYNFQYSIGEVKDSNHIICDISLPNDKEISNVKAYKEYKRDLRIEPIYYSEKDYKKIYNSIIYSIVFRLINEVFTTDYNSQIRQLTINGWTNALNKRNGKYENKCILSLSLSGEQFEDIDFNNVDLKEAFKHLKGISAASLIDFIPVAPIMSINKDDKRFIQSEEVLKNISDSTNIAAIDWEEFEHLVRELFEKEFAVNGGEVKVTQSSRDGGVDAIAFDPDPIRGGKIIIQSKRYTNVVGVSAIRDLYGTVVNEGANKGIIVTTSHYGNDAYEFAKGKPLTLLDGNELLYLLGKHGYKAKIDIEEAKNILKSN